MDPSEEHGHNDDQHLLSTSSHGTMGPPLVQTSIVARRSNSSNNGNVTPNGRNTANVGKNSGQNSPSGGEFGARLDRQPKHRLSDAELSPGNHLSQSSPRSRQSGGRSSTGIVATIIEGIDRATADIPLLPLHQMIPSGPSYEPVGDSHVLFSVDDNENDTHRRSPVRHSFATDAPSFSSQGSNGPLQQPHYNHHLYKKRRFWWLFRFFRSGDQHEARTFQIGVNLAHQKFPPNVVRNQKYHMATFLVVVLFEQFSMFFNMYFLLVAVSQLVPALKIGYLFTYFAPLGFVLSVTLFKEAYDDYARYLRDKEANGQLYVKWTEDGPVSVPSASLKVGDLVRIQKNQRIPADLVLLRTTEAGGACFIRTDQLDGETDWKLRLAVPSTQALSSDEDLFRMMPEIYAEKPHKDIYNFIGTLTRRVGNVNESEPLGVENTLWANTVLASGTALGVVIYTGSDTKAVLNTSHPSTKVGKLELELTRLSKLLALITVLLSLILVALKGMNGLWYIYLTRFIILFSSIIPISLRVNLDMGKTVYSWFVMHDSKIPGTIVRTSTIPEELGRVEYLLTDKTGTLTKNDMELKKLHMGTMSYGAESNDEVYDQLMQAFDQRRQSVIHKEDRMKRLNQRGKRDMGSRLTEIVQAMALCHNVTPVDEHGQMIYQAASPDEVAIVNWTKRVGLTLVERDLTSMTLTTPQGYPLHFDILNVFPFTSETKRMGIIVRDRQTQVITFYEKGADAVMSRIVQYNDWLEEECGNMAREGLRTLVFGRKFLSEENYQEFERRFQEARLAVVDRAQSIQKCVASFLESDLELLGLSGVEDKLQDDVKATLELLRNAGIKIWMLTGDKVETATCIAISSKLVARNQHIYQVQHVNTVTEAESVLNNLSTRPDQCLVVDGQSLQYFLDHHRDAFISTTTALPVVVCCRCSPTQKADVAKLIKQFTGKRVCCIGDGGNDVSMIQAAHVGVGIVGKEGKQASLAADFSIDQFSFLARLLVWHGRNSYKRSAKLSQFVMHRGLIIAMMQAVFSAFFYFAPIALYQGLLVVGYSTIYTMAPVFSIVLDMDVSDDVALMYPELYKDLLKGRSLSYKTFLSWLLISVYQGGAIMILSIWLFENQFIHIVSISFTALVLNELIMVAIEITTWHRIMVISEILTLLIYIASMAFLKNYFDLKFILTSSFVWKVAVITAVSCAPLFVIKRLKRWLAPPAYAKLNS